MMQKGADHHVPLDAPEGCCEAILELLPLLRGEPSRYEAIYGSYLQLQRSIRTRRHKLIVYPAAKVVRLFDLEEDPAEQRDLAGNPSSQGLIRDLFAQLLELQRQFDDPLELTSVFAELAKN